MTLEIRTVADHELTAYRQCLMTVFGEDLDVDPDGDARMRALIPPAQRWAAFDGGQIVATAGTFDHAIGMPGGGTLPMAGLTMVTVRPTHRRRGLLKQLIARHLEDARARGYAISGLWASEAAIYGRFGYGLAAHADQVSIENCHTLELREPGGDEIAWIDEAAARTTFPPVYARATALRPGALRRFDTWWHERRFLESPFARSGASRLRHVVARRNGEVVGYVQFRQKIAWELTRANGKIEIIEMIGIDSRAELSLWQFLLRVDLFPTISWSKAPVDDVLAWAVTDPRRVSRRRTDTLWLRIDDVARTLQARTYACAGALVFESHGATWELVFDGTARCQRSDRTPQLRFRDTALAAIVLGGELPSRLARAGWIDGDTTTADAMFASAIAPWCPEIF